MSDTVAAREPSGAALGWVALLLGLVAAWSGFNALSYASDALLEGTISEGQSVGLIYGLWAGAILLGLPASVLGLRAGFGSGMANKGELAGMWGWMLGAAASSAIIALMAYGFLGRPLAEALDDVRELAGLRRRVPRDRDRHGGVLRRAVLHRALGPRRLGAHARHQRGRLDRAADRAAVVGRGPAQAGTSHRTCSGPRLT